MRDDGLALSAATGVGTRELAERSLAGADARIDVALEDNLGAGGHVEVIVQVGLNDVSRHAVVQSAHELVLVLGVANGGGSHEGHQRGITEGHADGELLILLLGLSELLGDVVHSQALHTDAVGALDLDAIGADIHLVEVVGLGGVAGNDGSLTDEHAAVLLVDAIQREQIEQVDVLGAVDDVLLAGSVVALKDVGLDREKVPAAIQLEELILGAGVLVHAHHESVICPGTVNIGDDAVTRAITLDVIEHDGRAVGHTAGGTAGRTDIRLGENLIGHVNELALFLERGEERTKILIHL